MIVMATHRVKVEVPELSSKNAAAYLPFKTLLSAIESLEHGIPKKIDRTIWRTQSYVVQTQIIMALRFLGLLDEQDIPTPKLHQLVEKKNDRKIILNNILVDAYRKIIDLDLTKTTPKMLDDEMEAYNVTGDTKKKAVRFFLQAAKYVDMPLHPLLKAQTRNTGPRKKRVAKAAVAEGIQVTADPGYNAEERATSTTIAHLSNGGRMILSVYGDPFSLPGDERTMVFELVDKLKAHAALHSQSDDEDGEEEDAE
jgi:hypothetical protein